jgi:hypothetical protein
MIITRSKTEEEIKEMVEPFDKIFVVGCGTCATSCQTGGEEQVKEMVETLGEKVKGYAMVEEPCDIRIDRKDLRAYKDETSDSNAILVMSCGAGVQTVGDFTKKIVIPALDTLFIGQTERIGRYYDICKACGECILDETGGICSITKCPKSLLNGPCGGQVDGKCEVGEYKNDCAWVLIYNRLMEQGRLDLFTKFRLPRDYSKKVLLTEYIFK